MAKIYGIELKNIKNFVGHEGLAFQANVYLNGKKVGTFTDDGWGGNGWLEADKDNRKKITDVIDKYYKDNPKIDILKVFQMTPDEFRRNRDKGTLPKETETFEPIYTFMWELHELKTTESEWKKGVKKGYKAIVVVKYEHVKNTPTPLDSVWYSNGSQESINSIQKSADEKSVANYIVVYSSSDDFNVKEK